MKKVVVGCVGFMALASIAAQRIVETADFLTGLNTNGWVVAPQEWASPVYPAPVAAFSLAGTNLSEGASFHVNYAGGAFSVASTGGAQLTAFSVAYVLSRLETPRAVVITNVIDGHLEVQWAPVADAVGYRVDFYTNRLDGAAAGKTIFEETFAQVPSKGNAQEIDLVEQAGYLDTAAGWQSHACYYGINQTGVLQVGGSSRRGFVSFLPPAGACDRTDVTLEISAQRFNASTAPDVPVCRVTSSGETNQLGVVTLTEALAAYKVSLPPLAATDRLYLHSGTNKQDGRIILDTIRLITGYQAGTNVATRFLSVKTNLCAYAVGGLPRTDVSVRVTALAADAADHSSPSAAVGVDLADPPRMPILRAYPLSSSEDGSYATDFGELSAITAKSTWYNGVWPMAYWMGLKDRGGLVDSIGRATAGSTVSGFFSFKGVNDEGVETYALGFRGSSENDFHYGIAIHNDTDSPRRQVTIAYRGVQWNWKNKVETTNTFSYLVSDTLVDVAADGAWTAVPALDFVTPVTQNTAAQEQGPVWRAPQEATLAGVTLGAGQYLILRWTDAAAKSDEGSGGVAVSQFRLTTERVPRTSYVLIR